MTNREIGARLGRFIKSERRFTNEVLELINLAYKQKTYLEFGFSSMFDWLTRGFGYSNAAAYRRMEAAKLLRAVPAVKEKLERGETNLSSLSKAQSLIKTEEKKTGQKVSAERKAEVVAQLENKSTREVEVTLAGLFPGVAPAQERKVQIDATTTRRTMNFTSEAEADLKRAKEVLSHVLPNASDSEVIAYALKFFLTKKDPLTRPASASERKAGRVNVAAMKRVALQMADGTCEFVDSGTGNRCGSRYQVEVDHIIPKALGGRDESQNFRVLCKQHNLFMAEKFFGPELMKRYWNTS